MKKEYIEPIVTVISLTAKANVARNLTSDNELIVDEGELD